MDVDRLRMVEEADGLAFQLGLFDALLDRTRAGHRRPIEIELQPVEVTNALLRERGISPRESWELDSQELADLLSVDAVVRSEVHKRRYRSNWASFGWEIGQEILHEADHHDDEHYGGGYSDGGHAPIFAKTHDVVVDTALIDGRSGTVVWGLEVQTEINWTRRPGGIVRSVAEQVAREFPYRG